MNPIPSESESSLSSRARLSSSLTSSSWYSSAEEPEVESALPPLAPAASAERASTLPPLAPAASAERAARASRAARARVAALPSPLHPVVAAAADRARQARASFRATQTVHLAGMVAFPLLPRAGQVCLLASGGMLQMNALRRGGIVAKALLAGAVFAAVEGTARLAVADASAGRGTSRLWSGPQALYSASLLLHVVAEFIIAGQADAALDVAREAHAAR